LTDSGSDLSGACDDDPLTQKSSLLGTKHFIVPLDHDAIGSVPNHARLIGVFGGGTALLIVIPTFSGLVMMICCSKNYPN
jgi:hypothetical protein